MLRVMRSAGASKQSSVTGQNLKISCNPLSFQCVSTLYRVAAAALCSLSVYPTPAKVFPPVIVETYRSWRKKPWVKDSTVIEPNHFVFHPSSRVALRANG